MFSRIVVPLDGSDVAEQALGPAEELAGKLGVPVHLVRVADVVGSDYTYAYGYMLDGHLMAERLDNVRELAAEYLIEVAKPMIQLGLAVTTELRNGSATAELESAMQPGDLFVMASHGRSGLARWYLGSVAEQLIRTATVPVMLIRAHSGQSRLSRASASHPANTHAVSA
jgi:nucleotide-binding universal stress UspA family protein